MLSFERAMKHLGPEFRSKVCEALREALSYTDGHPWYVSEYQGQWQADNGFGYVRKAETEWEALLFAVECMYSLDSPEPAYWGMVVGTKKFDRVAYRQHQARRSGKRAHDSGIVDGGRAVYAMPAEYVLPVAGCFNGQPSPRLDEMYESFDELETTEAQVEQLQKEGRA